MAAVINFGCLTRQNDGAPACTAAFDVMAVSNGGCCSCKMWESTSNIARHFNIFIYINRHFLQGLLKPSPRPGAALLCVSGTVLALKVVRTTYHVSGETT